MGDPNGVTISRDVLNLLIDGAILAMQQRIHQGDPGYMDPPDDEERDSLACDWTHLADLRGRDNLDEGICRRPLFKDVNRQYFYGNR